MLNGRFAASVPDAINARYNSEIDRFILSCVVFVCQWKLLKIGCGAVRNAGAVLANDERCSFGCGFGSIIDDRG